MYGVKIALSRGSVLISMIHGKFPTSSIGGSLDSGNPSTADFYVSVGMIRFIISTDSHIRLESSFRPFSGNGADLPGVPLGNITDYIVGKISALF